jgi:hypothetical protein
MRFFLSGNRHDIEMIGERVDIAAAPNEVFAVHPNVFSDMRVHPYSVTHTETGFRLGRGTSIQGAILDAINACVNLKPGQLDAQLDMARDLRRSVALSTSPK